MNKALLSSKNMCWCTPQDFFDKLNEEFCFTLDAAATDKTAKCPLYFTPETDGLKSSWKVAGGGTVFCNPPYGREIGKWVQKAYEEAQAGTPIVLLMRGDDVKALQTALIERNYHCGTNGADGTYGRLTAYAVRCFQASKGLIVNGRADRYTIAALGGTWKE